MLTLIKSRKKWLEFKELAEQRLNNMPFVSNMKKPAQFPCLCEVIISSDMINGFKINYVVFYKKDAKKLIK